MKKNLFLPFIFLIAFIGFMETSNFLLFFHETGHVFFCNLIGGRVGKIEYTERGGKVGCNVPEDTPAFNLFLFYMGGILFEFILGLIFLLIPHTSALGGYVLFKIGTNTWLRRYEWDLKYAGLSVLNQTPFRLTIFLSFLTIFSFSIYSYFSFWKKIER